MLTAVGQPVAQFQNETLTRGETVQYLLYFFRCHAADDRVFQLVRVRAENVLIGDVVAFAIAAYRSESDTSPRRFRLARRVIRISFSMHRAAYVPSGVPDADLKLSTALISPITPMEIRSSAP